MVSIHDKIKWNLISSLKTMEFYQLIKILLIIQVVILIDVSAVELHRTTTALLRNSAKTRRGLNSLSEDVADSDSNVYPEIMLFGHCNLETFGCAMLSSILIGLSGIFPLLVIPIESGPSLKHGAAAARLKLLLSFAVGALLGDVFLHLLPEAWAHLDKESGTNAYTSIGLWVITGILMFLIIEKIFGDKDDNSSEEPEEREHTSIKENGSVKSKKITNDTDLRKRRFSKSEDDDGTTAGNGRLRSHSFSTVSKINITGYLNLLANVIDNFTHGLAVGGSYLVSVKVGMVTTIAILLHEIPHEIGDFAILLKSGFNRWKAAKAQILTASGGVIGALTALSAESPEVAGNRTAWILPFTSGGFLYIALVTVVPELLQEKRGWESIKQVIGLIAGVLSMVLVTVLFEE